MMRSSRHYTIARRWIAAASLATMPSLAGAQGDRPAAPPPLHWESVAWDPEHGRLILFGGTGPADYLSTTWEWDGTRWSTLADSASSPGARHAHAMGWDALRSRVVLFGGLLESRDTTIPSAQRARRFCDTWALKDATWTRIDRGGACAIEGVDAASIVSRGTGGDLLLVEGPRAPATDGTLARVRLWRWSDTTWTLADSSGPRRSPDTNGRAAYDERRSVLVVPILGGPDAGVWEWDGVRWKHVRAVGPPARRNFGIAYDARRARVVLLGGLAANPRRWLGDHWTWDGASWTEVPTATMQPSARSHTTLLNDARGGRLLYFGGASEQGIRRELWVFDAHGWKAVEK